MKRSTNVNHLAAAAAQLERITLLDEQLAGAPPNSRRRRTLKAAIHVEAAAYRKSLDIEQATATHDSGSTRPARR